ncbi:MAG: hypothetical protein VB025_05175 [Sphaerochaeta sp.]|jgi:hypothetical protein|nr:hypothetical protein [Sphaerochaeta sp.]PKL28990.1 MAG: hypothetical protein CVV46_03205 [Spirochaetae bacterium HGW-Spirochaetae-2]
MNMSDRGIFQAQDISVREKTLAIVMLVVIFASCVVPVSQAARNRELTMSLSRIESESVLIEERQRVVASRIAQAQLPEMTMRQSVLKGLSLEKIVFEEAKIVVVGE